jgi:hypothetical protein
MCSSLNNFLLIFSLPLSSSWLLLLQIYHHCLLLCSIHCFNENFFCSECWYVECGIHRVVCDFVKSFNCFYVSTCLTEIKTQSNMLVPMSLSTHEKSGLICPHIPKHCLLLLGGCGTGLQLKALHCKAGTWVTPCIHFALVVLEMGTCKLFAWLALIHNHVLSFLSS